MQYTIALPRKSTRNLVFERQKRKIKKEDSDTMIREINKDDFDRLMELYTQLHGNSIPESTYEMMEKGSGK